MITAAAFNLQYRTRFCMQDTFARARTQPLGQARAMIGYHVYKTHFKVFLNIKYDDFFSKIGENSRGITIVLHRYSYHRRTYYRGLTVSTYISSVLNHSTLEFRDFSIRPPVVNIKLDQRIYEG